LPDTKDEIIKKEFAVRLIGRLIFCWFLKKKTSKANIQLVPDDILSTEAIENNKGVGNYYHSVLEPLFFEALNTPIDDRKKDYNKAPWNLIPFLNGGLFNPHSNDFYEMSDVGYSKYINTLKVPDPWLKKLLEIFETYNFTIDENTPVDVELSIEPEMLGRIFENLLAEINPETGDTARKSTGSYYTPRSIVEYMVDESLKQYLLTKTDISEDKITKLLSYSDYDGAKLTEKQNGILIEALHQVKIIDPACGSGAFPMGILQKIFLMLQKLDPDSKIWLEKMLANIPDPMYRKELKKKKIPKYIHKLGIIKDCIFGVDIQPIAVEISKLRCFLSLIVDEIVNDNENNRGIEHLPNLEFKFVCANTLIGLPKTQSQKGRVTKSKLGNVKMHEAKGQTSIFEAKDKIDQLKEFRDLYLTSYGKEKKDIEKQFRKVQSEMFQHSLNWGGKDSQTTKLSQWNPFSDEASSWFDPDWMFGVPEGFDIVIANPPYLGEKGHKEIFREIKQGQLGEFYQGKMDLFYFFFHLALNIAADDSQVAFITTNYFPTAYGAKKLRNDFKTRSIVRNMVNFNELKIFESALGQHNMITILEKAQAKTATATTSITQKQGIAKPEILQQLLNGNDPETLYCQVKQKDLYDGEENYIRLRGSYDLSEDPIQRILGKIKKQGISLGIMCRINNGIHSEADRLSAKKYNLRDDKKAQVGDGIYVLNKTNLADSKQISMILGSKKESKYLKPFFKNSDIYKWSTSKDTNKKIIYLNKQNDNINDLPLLRSQLLRFKTIIDKSSDNSPYLHRPKTETDFVGAKIIAPQRSKTNAFGYNEIMWYAASDVFFITQKDKSMQLKYILALINSKLYYLWLYHKGKRKGETLELIAKPLSEIPIKKISGNDQKPFVAIVDKILAIAESEDYQSSESKQTKVKKLQEQLDQMVYKLYDLTEEEFAIVEGENDD
jgi:adenine-specific DNA-methyltransferase